MALVPHLGDGTVLPHFLGVNRTPRHDPGPAFDNISLRLGEVKEIVWPDDPRSRSKRLVEYRVYVEQRVNGTGNGRMYENCLLANPFGGLADRASWTLRAAASDRSKASRTLGSKVLLLCVNGENAAPVIVGGMRDPRDEGDDGTKSEPTHQLDVTFNGVKITVNGDGEFVLTYGGKTDADGTTQVSEDVAGAFVKLDRDGGVTVSDGTGKNSVRVNHKDGKVQIARDQAFELGEATDHMLLGESYRKAQQELHDKLQAQLQTLQQLVVVASTALNAAGTAMQTPVTGAVAAATPIAGAGAAFQAVGAAAGNMRQALADFEQAAAQKNSFLSKKNSSD